MPKVCIYPHCFNQQKPGCSVTFHKLPRDPDILKLWLLAMSLSCDEGPSFLARDVRVCGEHFSKDDYRIPSRGQPQSKILKWFAVPFTFVLPGEHPVITHMNGTLKDSGENSTLVSCLILFIYYMSYYIVGYTIQIQ